jgi:hypothetical protein
MKNRAVQAVPICPAFVPTFLAASALLGAPGGIAAAVGPEIASGASTATETLQQILFEKATDPLFLQNVIDFIEGYAPGPIPPSWAGYAGSCLGGGCSLLIHNVGGGYETVQQYLKGSVPH